MASDLQIFYNYRKLNFTGTPSSYYWDSKPGKSPLSAFMEAAIPLRSSDPAIVEIMKSDVNLMRHFNERIIKIKVIIEQKYCDFY
jgi:hypothetical protein